MQAWKTQKAHEPDMVKYTPWRPDQGLYQVNLPWLALSIFHLQAELPKSIDKKQNVYCKIIQTEGFIHCMAYTERGKVRRERNRKRGRGKRSEKGGKTEEGRKEGERGSREERKEKKKGREKKGGREGEGGSRR